MIVGIVLAVLVVMALLFVGDIVGAATVRIPGAVVGQRLQRVVEVLPIVSNDDLMHPYATHLAIPARCVMVEAGLVEYEIVVPQYHPNYAAGSAVVVCAVYGRFSGWCYDLTLEPPQTAA